jgi:hypothetical protein
MYVHKTISKDKKIIFCWHLEDQWREEQDPEPGPLVRGTDPDPYLNFMDPEHSR